MVLNLRLLLVFVVFAASTEVSATTYDLTPPLRPALCQGQQGSWSGNTYTCGWGSPFSITSSDVITSGQNITIHSNNGFNLTGGVLGNSTFKVALSSGSGQTIKLSNVTHYGAINGHTVELSNVTHYGAVNGQTIKLSNVTEYGDINGHTVNIDQSYIDGNVIATGGTITASKSTVTGEIQATNNSIVLKTVDVWGLVSSGTSKVTVSEQSIIRAGISAGVNGIEVKDSEVTGDLTAGNNPINLTNVTMHSGNISVGSNSVTISGGDINANIPNAHRVFISNNAVVRGIIQARYEVDLNQSTVHGTIITTDDYQGLHSVKLTNSTVYGNVYVRTDWGTINGNWPHSAIYGECEYKSVTPNLCEAGPPLTGVKYRLSYSPQALSCNEIPVLIEILDSQNNLLPNQQATVDLLPANRWIGSDTVSFAGQTITYLKRDVGIYNLGLGSTEPIAEALICSSQNCTIEISDSGFIIQVPNLVAGVEMNATIQALKTDDMTKICVPSFAGGTRNIVFSSSYANPSSGTLAPKVESSSLAAPNSVSLNFNNQAQATFSIQYDDVGVMDLLANYVGTGAEDGLTMRGFAKFTTRPHTFIVNNIVAENAEAKLNPQRTSEENGGFIAAGENFSVWITALNKQGEVTLNWGQEQPRQTISLTSHLYYPELSIGNEGVFTSGTVSAVVSGQQRLNGNKWSEVGSIQLEASTNYLGTGDALFWSSDIIGRFFPYDFEIKEPNLVLNGCTNFSYMSAPNIYYKFDVLALNAEGVQVQNYHDEVGFFEGNRLAQVVSELYQGSGINASRFSGTLNRWDVATAKWVHGEYQVEQADAVFHRAVNGPDGPYSLQPGIRIDFEQDGRDLSNLNLGSEATALNGALDLRYGRLFVENAIGPEDEDLPLDVSAEYWDGSGFIMNDDDNCTGLSASAVLPLVFHSEVPVTITAGSNQTKLFNGSSIINLQSGVWLNKTYQRGEGKLEYISPAWLQYNWTGVSPGIDQNPKAEFIFGQFRGFPRIIFRREYH